MNNFVKHLHKFKRFINTFNHSSLKFVYALEYKMNKYKEAVNALNELQSNAAYLRERSSKKPSYEEEYEKTIFQMQKFLLSAGITTEKLNNLQVIHVGGTKGKGSTCAYCESILRHHGYKTGFYSSPHLLEVRERIRIDGKPISHDMFAKNFWYIYDKLSKDHQNNFPAYFRFLTIMAFHIFLKEKIDVAIIEVGIGGEFDCTNVLERTPVIGITSLGIDHTNILGSTIQDIAWHKSGIFKENAKAFTMPQNEDAMKVLIKRSKDRKISLEVVHPFVNIEEIGKSIPDVSSMNASLAVTLAYSWIKSIKGINVSLKEFTDFAATKNGLATVSWPGRYQVIYSEHANYYLDGAHTVESMDICVKWFKTMAENSSRKQVLIFNMIGHRDVEKILSILIGCKFYKVFFVPNISGKGNSTDNKLNDINFHITKCNAHRNIWMNLLRSNNLEVVESNISTHHTVNDVINEISRENYDCLITGSLHLMGAALDILDPELKQSQNNSKILINNFILNS